MAKNILLSRGQALSFTRFSGSINMASTAILVDSRDSAAQRTIKVQGFNWTGLCTCTVVDGAGSVLFKSTRTGARIWPNSASGSAGLTVVTPLYMSTSGGHMGVGSWGGYLTIYGEVL